MTLKKPAAFMSYVHSDDKDGHLTTLRERLSDEVQVQTGLEFPIFQDRKDIHWGQNWRQRIEDSLDEITFLIPIITPSFFNSKACRDELARFVEHEKKLNRNDLILPIYFVDTPRLNEAELRETDESAQVIASRQYADWRELRFEPFTNPQVRRTLAQLAVQIRTALPRVQTTKKAPAKTAAAANTQPTAATTSEGSEQPKESPTSKTEPPTRIVDPLHRGHFTTITQAIKDVEPGTRILVRPGLYQEGLVIDKPLEIIGDGEAGEIVIQAAGMNAILFQTTMGRVVNLTLRQVGEGEWFCVAITQGRLEVEDCDIASQSRACVGIRGGADPRLRRNRIHDSKESGVHVYENAQGTLEDNDIFGHARSGVGIRQGAAPTLRRNRIHSTRENGIFVLEGGLGTIEDNDIFGNAFAGVGISSEANPTLRRNRIHDNKQNGVYVNAKGQSTLDDNDVFNNAYSGITSRSGSNPIVRNNRINRNGHYGVRVHENGGGAFENNDLTGNSTGAWSISEDSKANVTRANNKE